MAEPTHLRVNSVHTTCTREECDRRHYARGFCQKHWQWNRNHGVEMPTYPKAPALDCLKGAVESAGEKDCIEWPFGRSGEYGQMTVDGRPRGAYEVAMELDGRPRPRIGRFQARHTCNNPICVNPRHLRWGSWAQNQADRVVAGTDNRGSRNGQAKLSESDVREIRRLYSLGIGPTEIGKRFPQVTVKCVSAIANGRSWRWL